MTCKEIELQEDAIDFYKKHIHTLESLSFRDADCEEHLMALKRSLQMLKYQLQEMKAFARKRLTPIIRRR